LVSQASCGSFNSNEVFDKKRVYNCISKRFRGTPEGAKKKFGYKVVIWNVRAHRKPIEKE
jgi:hypothetical protein